jgi:hypothetical protein
MTASLVLAWHHPLWPVAALLGCGLWSLLSAWRTSVWQFALPLAAVALNFSPWTGWLAWGEFDMLVLSSLAGAYAQKALTHAFEGGRPTAPRQACVRPAARALLLAMAGAALVGMLRGWLDADPALGFGYAAGPTTPRPFDWFAGYTDAANSLRVAKSELYALLLVPLWPRADAGLLPLARGMVAGLAVVVCAVLWERLAFPGIWNFDAPYRSVALLWEMHVGGAALDGFLALATPFAVWAVVSARRPWAWSAAAVLAMLALYALLTSFSRGVYAATLLKLTLLALLLLRQQVQLHGWRARGATVLALVLLGEVALVALGGGFLWQRVAASGHDLGSRIQHWQRGLATLQQPTDWLLGLGTGRLPAHYAASGAAGEFSGAVRWSTEAPAFATLSGPANRRILGGQFALTQRTPSVAHGEARYPHSLLLKLRVHSATELMAQWCERHLLFDGRCQTAWLRVVPTANPWQTHLLQLREEPPPRATAHRAARTSPAPEGPWHAPAASPGLSGARG